jgi:hypothetical protein
MAANTAPIYSRVGQIEWASSSSALTTASTAKDGTGATLVFTADATEGSWVTKIRFRPAGTNVASMARIFINNGSTSATAANNVLWDEITLPATTGTESAALIGPELTLGFALPPGYRIYVALGTTVSAGYYVTVIGGKY